MSKKALDLIRHIRSELSGFRVALPHASQDKQRNQTTAGAPLDGWDSIGDKHMRIIDAMGGVDETNAREALRALLISMPAEQCVRGDPHCRR